MIDSFAFQTAARQHRVHSAIGDLSDPTTSLLDTMVAGGVVPANPIELRARLADGALTRFATTSKPRRRNGWLVVFFDNGIPVFALAGDWAKGVRIRWRFQNQSHLSASQRREQCRRIERAKALRRAEKAEIQAEAACRATRIWERATLAEQHPYLTRKRIRPHRARRLGDSLVLDVRDFDRRLHTLQFIQPDGGKQLLSGGAKKGHFVPVAGPEFVTDILICEGWATGCTLADEYPESLVLAAIDSGNLTPVASGARNHWPDAEIIICADDDRITQGNPGASAARSAARIARCSVTFPPWPAHAPLELSDFNDLANWLREGA